MKPSEISKRSFTLVRRGFDPQEVGQFLEAVATHVAGLERECRASAERVESMESQLSDARSAEEAVRMTMIAATKAKDEMLEAARSEATAIRTAANEEASSLHGTARADAERIITEARTESLALLSRARDEAQAAVAAAREENAGLAAEIETLRAVVDRVRSALRAIAEGSAAPMTQIDSVMPSQASRPADNPETAPVTPRIAVEIDHAPAAAAPILEDALVAAATLAAEIAAVPEAPNPAPIASAEPETALAPRRKPTIHDKPSGLDEEADPRRVGDLLSELRGLTG